MHEQPVPRRAASGGSVPARAFPRPWTGACPGASASLPDRHGTLRPVFDAPSSVRGGLCWALWAALVVLGTAGCGGVSYSLRIVQASDALARAEQLGAAVRAPYEYHYALEHLRKAREQASRSEYGTAERLADTAHTYANRAVQLAQRVEPVAPRGSEQP